MGNGSKSWTCWWAHILAFAIAVRGTNITSVLGAMTICSFTPPTTTSSQVILRLIRWEGFLTSNFEKSEAVIAKWYLSYEHSADFTSMLYNLLLVHLWAKSVTDSSGYSCFHVACLYWVIYCCFHLDVSVKVNWSTYFRSTPSHERQAEDHQEGHPGSRSIRQLLPIRCDCIIPLYRSIFLQERYQMSPITTLVHLTEHRRGIRSTERYVQNGQLMFETLSYCWTILYVALLCRYWELHALLCSMQRYSWDLWWSTHTLMPSSTDRIWWQLGKKGVIG